MAYPGVFLQRRTTPRSCGPCSRAGEGAGELIMMHAENGIIADRRARPAGQLARGDTIPACSHSIHGPSPLEPRARIRAIHPQPGCRQRDRSTSSTPPCRQDDPRLEGRSTRPPRGGATSLRREALSTCGSRSRETLSPAGLSSRDREKVGVTHAAALAPTTEHNNAGGTSRRAPPTDERRCAVSTTPTPVTA